MYGSYITRLIIFKTREMKLSIFILFVLLVSCEEMETSIIFEGFTDERDGQTYATVEIGERTWMAENLNYKPRTGDYLITESFGVLYSFNSAVSSCPYGWRLPTDEEWKEVGICYPDEASLRSGDFEALLGGWVNGDNYEYGRTGAWWTSVEIWDDYTWIYCFHRNGYLIRMTFPQTNKVCVRCIKDY